MRTPKGFGRSNPAGFLTDHLATWLSGYLVRLLPVSPPLGDGLTFLPQGESKAREIPWPTMSHWFHRRIDGIFDDFWPQKESKRRRLNLVVELILDSLFMFV